MSWTLRLLAILFSISLFAQWGYCINNTRHAEHIASLDKQSQEANRDSVYVRILNERTSDLMSVGELDSALVLSKKALNLAKRINDREGEGYATANIGKYYDMRGMPDSTVSSLEDGLITFEGTRQHTRLGNLLATAHQQLGNYQRALEIYTNMLDVAVADKDTTMQIALTQNLGNSYSSLGDIPSAINHYLESLEMAEEKQDTLALAVVLDNLASINVNEENFELAEDYLFRALDLNREINNVQNQITNHISLGVLYKDWEKYEMSREQYNRVLELADQTENVISRIQAIYNLGILYTEMGETDVAIESFQESLRLSEENNISIGFFYNRAGMGNVYSEMGEYETAIENYQEALEIAEMVQATEMIRNTLLNLYETSELAGDTLLAYPYLHRYSQLTDSLSQTEREEALARQEAMLNLRTEREQREILEEAVETQHRNTIIVWTLLAVIVIALIGMIFLNSKKRKANILLQKRTKELSEVNDVKDKLLSVLAHDLRTPISNIQGVVYMIRENLLEKQDLDKALTQIDFQLQQGINTLTNYLEWAQNHRGNISADMEYFRLLDVVQPAVHEIKKSAENKGAELINKMDGEIDVYADKHMLNVILRNLLSNAIKYVGSGENVIVDAKETPDGVELSVSDTGEGIPSAKLENLFKPFKRVTRGTGGEIGTGLGLSLCKEFTEKQGGTIRCESEMGKGTIFTVTLQKADGMKNHEEIAENQVQNS